jgi:hypothetical protein
VLEELQTIAESLAARLRRSVTVDDLRFNVLVHTPHHAERVDRYRVDSIMQKAVGKDLVDWVLGHGIATATAPVRIPANDRLGVLARVCVPVRCQSILLAYLWLLDPDGSVSDADLDQAVESANAAGGVLFRERLLGDLRRGRERELVRDLLASDPSVREHAARQLVAGDRLPDGAEVAVVAVLAGPIADHADADVAIDLALQHAERRLAPSHTISTSRSGAGGVLLVAGRQPAQAARLQAAAEGLQAELAAALGPDAAVHVGIGPVVPSIALAHKSPDCALYAARVGAQVPGFAPVAAWDGLGVYRLLVQLPLDQVRDNAIPAGLVRLLEADDSGALLETLEVYLDEACRAPVTVERLNIHRTSLYYRLNRIERLTGMSLGNGGDRLALHLGIKLARLMGLEPGGVTAG